MQFGLFESTVQQSAIISECKKYCICLCKKCWLSVETRVKAAIIIGGTFVLPTFQDITIYFKGFILLVSGEKNNDLDQLVEFSGKQFVSGNPTMATAHFTKCAHLIYDTLCHLINIHEPNINCLSYFFIVPTPLMKMLCLLLNTFTKL